MSACLRSSAASLRFFYFNVAGAKLFLTPAKSRTSHSKFANDCAKCHDSNIGGGNFRTVLGERFRNGVSTDEIDPKCEACHQKHSFHEANVVDNRACSACHQEHRGLTNLGLVASSQCMACHNNSEIMASSAQKGMTLPHDAFHRHPHPPQQIVFELPRSQQGYTATFANFWEGHPEFQLKRESMRDPDTLRFNHQRHFASDIPPINGQKLDCNYCHQPQTDSRFMQRISYAANCQACHSLQFDWRNPDMRIPHGNVDLVRTFLRSLPAQYADYARLKRGISEREVSGFVGQQIKQLRDQFRSGDELEHAVFFTKDPYKPQQTMGAAVRGNFTGCAFCHEVKATANGVPSVDETDFDRSLDAAGQFQSRQTSDRSGYAEAARLQSLSRCGAKSRNFRCADAVESELHRVSQSAGQSRRGVHHLSHLSCSASRADHGGAKSRLREFRASNSNRPRGD